MYRLFLFLLTALNTTTLTAQNLTYTFSPGNVAGKPALHVAIDLDGLASGITYLAYQDIQFGDPGQMSALQGMRVSKDATVSKDPDNNRLVLRHAPKARLRVEYDLVDLQQEAQPFYQYCCYNPIVHEDYFHVQAGHLLAIPEHYWSSPEDQKTVLLQWENFPKNWVLHNSFGPAKSQRLRLTNAQFNSAIFVGGDFRRHRFEVQGQPVFFVTRGRWSTLTDDTLTQLLRRTVEGHRTFWNDFADSTYTVTFLPIYDAPWRKGSHFSSTGGSGLTQSFMSYATDNPGLTYDLIRYIYVHELMHHWIGIKIENAQEERQYWFSEGFTEYFTLKNSLRYGFITPDEFLKTLNTDFVTPHYSAPNKTAPNDSINYAHFWSGDKNWEKLPYRRGCLYAFYLDNQIRARSQDKANLDQVLRNILHVTARKPSQKLTHKFFLKMLKPLAGKAATKDFTRFIERGELIDFRGTVLPTGLTVLVKDVTMSYGKSPTEIDRTEVFKDVPVFKRDSSVSDAALKAALLR